MLASATFALQKFFFSGGRNLLFKKSSEAYAPFYTSPGAYAPYVPMLDTPMVILLLIIIVNEQNSNKKFCKLKLVANIIISKSPITNVYL